MVLWFHDRVLDNVFTGQRSEAKRSQERVSETHVIPYKAPNKDVNNPKRLLFTVSLHWYNKQTLRNQIILKYITGKLITENELIYILINKHQKTKRKHFYCCAM